MSINSNSSLKDLASRLDFFDLTCEQLQKEIPKYIKRNTDMSKSIKNFSLAIKSVASSEFNPNLKDFLFLYANKQDNIEKQLEIFNICEEQSLMLLDEAKLKIINPIRESIDDHNSNINKLKSHQKKKSKESLEILEYRLKMSENILPLHKKLLEKYKIERIKKIMHGIIYAEIKYHCKVVEELSPLISILNSIKPDK